MDYLHSVISFLNLRLDSFIFLQHSFCSTIIRLYDWLYAVYLVTFVLWTVFDYFDRPVFCFSCISFDIEFCWSIKRTNKRHHFDLENSISSSFIYDSLVIMNSNLTSIWQQNMARRIWKPRSLFMSQLNKISTYDYTCQLSLPMPLDVTLAL